MVYFQLMHLNKSKTKGKEGHRNSLFEETSMTSADLGFHPKGSIFLPIPYACWKSSQALKGEDHFVLMTGGKKNLMSTLHSIAQQKKYRSCIFLSHLFPAVGSMCKFGFIEVSKETSHFLCTPAKSTASPTCMIHTNDSQQAASPQHHCEKHECYLRNKSSKNTSQQVK